MRSVQPRAQRRDQVERQGKTYWLHRKGAAPTDSGIALIPGSRGDFSYVVRPLSTGWEHAYSMAHGAGRKWKRSEAKGKLKNRFHVKDLQKTKLGSFVICEDRELLYQEAPQAYKDINVVIDVMINASMIEVIAILRPLVTYKTTRKKKC